MTSDGILNGHFLDNFLEGDGKDVRICRRMIMLRQIVAGVLVCGLMRLCCVQANTD